MTLRAMGFCGADDSVDPKLLQLISKHYPWVEWGVLFRPDLEGTPRYATAGWVQRLSTVASETPMKLAAHLCSSRCQEILSGNWEFVSGLAKLGFARVQVNATAANLVVVDPSKIEEIVEGILKCIREVPTIEWIIQTNEETKEIWTRLVVAAPSNMSILFDASCGLGVAMTEFPTPLSNIRCGYAGGISPTNVSAMLARISEVCGDQSFWIDMESSLRAILRDNASGLDKDVFSIDKCFACIQAGVALLQLEELK
ncbi:unnamed protein product [Aphanomyces euteiches]|uniref:Uncharacterized protein n=1 Tax=Aphanomyces euteiches TaxID=100861 RepID=A0A6G0WHG3_9STRA|nr:hypothetical protein Ae201684_015227 [Aphanomyces euteiches]KAH9079997.1 hypothetical protein Ae201684P_020577 [Aphanomyces euteiches]KAH9117921.1 hypothetical protein LEN26_012338 [Aphanomyces euteiches]KAH9129100.1 hypothetical protein AeMF1_000811 [Aphanomyces euteiches]KAH9133829.1 hypothetical protein AeRB84_020200 [Aphanomyces euteiches]